MNDPLRNHGWPAARVGEALEALAQRARLVAGAGAGGPLSAGPFPTSPAALGRAIAATAARLGVEAEPVEMPYPELDAFLRHGGPALLRLSHGDGEGGEGEAEPRFLALVGGRRGRLELLGPDGGKARVGAETLRAALGPPLEAAVAPEVDRVLAEAHLRGRRRGRARAALTRELLAASRLGGSWLQPFGGKL